MDQNHWAFRCRAPLSNQNLQFLNGSFALWVPLKDLKWQIHLTTAWHRTSSALASLKTLGFYCMFSRWFWVFMFGPRLLLENGHDCPCSSFVQFDNLLRFPSVTRLKAGGTWRKKMANSKIPRSTSARDSGMSWTGSIRRITHILGCSTSLHNLPIMNRKIRMLMRWEESEWEQGMLNYTGACSRVLAGGDSVAVGTDNIVFL